MTDKEKLIKIKSLADKMYNAVFNLTTDASLLRKAMDDYHQFIIYEYYKEEPVSEDLEEAALLHYPKMSRISEPHGVIPADNQSHYLGDANEDKRKAFIVGAEWQKQQDQSTIELAEDHAILAGMEKMKEEMMAKAIEGEVITTSDYGWENIRIHKKEHHCGQKVKVIVIKEE